VKEIPAKLVAELRARTGAGMMDCKKALEEADGDLEKAVDILRQKGSARADKRAGREASEGLIGSYVHHDGGIAALVELNSESDFVARNQVFKGLAHEIALHVAAADPRYLRREDVPQEVLDRERSIFEAQARDQRKPDAVIQKIVEGKLNDFFKREVLLDQPWTKDDKQSIEHLVKEAIAKLGENITISRFARFKVGEAPAG